MQDVYDEFLYNNKNVIASKQMVFCPSLVSYGMSQIYTKMKNNFNMKNIYS